MAMLIFTDLNLKKNFINLQHVQNVCVTKQEGGRALISFHMMTSHVVPVSVDKITRGRIIEVLENYHV